MAALIHIEQLPGGSLNLKVKDAPTSTRMVRTAMEAREDVAAIFLAAVVHYIEDKKLNYTELKKMYIP